MSDINYTNPYNITADKLLAGLERAVQVRGVNFVYPAEWKSGTGMCLYADRQTGEPRCIFGFALMEIGVPAERIALSGQNIGSLLDELIDPEGAGALAELADPVVGAAMAAQTMQDQGETWGHVLEVYRSKLASSSATD